MSIALLWIVAGFVLIVAEFALTTFVVIFFGIAALLVGLLLWAGLPASYGVPYLLFAALSLGLVLVLRSRFRDWFTGRTISADADDDFIGHEVRIESGFDPAQPGRGRVAYRGASWDARSSTAEYPADAIARIVRRQGSQLDIAPLED